MGSGGWLCCVVFGSVFEVATENGSELVSDRVEEYRASQTP